MRALLILALATAASAQDPDVSHLVGRPYAGLPGGWAGVGGALLTSPDGQDYALSAFRNVDGGSVLFTYDRIDRMVDGRYPVSTVLAALAIDDVREGETASSFACRWGDELAVAVLGEQTYVEGDDLFRWGPVRRAWRLDRDAARFEPVAAEAVDCPDEYAP